MLELNHNIKWIIESYNLPKTDETIKSLSYLDKLFGLNHLYGKYYKCRNGVIINATHPNSLATFDFDALTRAVLLSHRMGVRFEITSSGPQMLKFIVFVDEEHKTNDDLKNMIKG